MGCGIGSVQPHHPRVSQGSSRQGAQSPNSSDFPVKFFSEIVNHVRSIAALPNMMPVVCFSTNSFPIVTCFLHINDSTPIDSEIQLPIVAASVYGRGRVICFSQIQFLTTKYMRVGDTRQFVSNCINWITYGQNTMTPVLGIGFTKQQKHNITHALKEIGIFIEYGSFKVNFTSYKAILIPSDIVLDDQKIEQLVEFVGEAGRGLAIFYNHTEYSSFSLPINDLLSKFSLSYTFCLLNEDVEVSENIQVPSSYVYIRDSNFVTLLDNFKNLIKQPNINTVALDDIVTVLRCYIMVCNDNYSKELSDLTDCAWEFLHRTNYHAENGICPEEVHGIVVVLLMYLYTILPVNLVKPIPEHVDFPGKTGDVELSDFQKTFKLQRDEWISTGLWLPAGVPATVICEPIIQGAHVQIGSQHESLLTKPGPWKRWPSIISVSLLAEKCTKVISAFGGIVYVGYAPTNPIQTETLTIDLTFHNFCEHPIADYKDPSIWERTKNIQVPWGEIVAKDITFTVPTSKMLELDNFDKIFEKFNIIIQEVTNYIGYSPPKPYRIVFDIELPEDCPSCGYPLAFDLQDIDNILSNFDSPTTQLFTAVTMLTVVSILEDCFDHVTETAIATLAASVVFQKLFPGFDPLEFAGISLPTLFHELWEIHNFDQTIIPKTLAKFQDPTHPISDVPEDMWISFVREICHIGGRNFTKLLERARPIPLNISISLQGLPTYKFGSECGDHSFSIGE
ncbi:hypothetical protein GPJ56_001703 [Histomonas meleagridis]|uniref:uncharacterized protein n=1 Tax=Histomonas meleagridis TaxID=135588 RepID=UPI003559A60F|nr:hypothetical protein GPJ56_001703 [Histomonas meleagridis]KAH0796211.1 hypothetical protein GO595_010104 [Histomonas meleagridis]